MASSNDVNPDFSQQAQIDWLPGQQGSCVPDSVIQEIVSRLKITLPQQQQSGPACISTQQNNLTSNDAAGCVFTPGVLQFKDQETWAVAAPAVVNFTGWPSGLDPTNDAFFVIIPQFSAADFGKGKIEIGIITALQIPVSVVPLPSQTLTGNVTLTLFIWTNPVPPQSTAS